MEVQGSSATDDFQPPSPSWTSFGEEGLGPHATLLRAGLAAYVRVHGPPSTLIDCDLAISQFAARVRYIKT